MDATDLRMYLKELVDIADKNRTPIGGETWDDFRRVILQINSEHSDKFADEVYRAQEEAYS